MTRTKNGKLPGPQAVTCQRLEPVGEKSVCRVLCLPKGCEAPLYSLMNPNKTVVDNCKILIALSKGGCSLSDFNIALCALMDQCQKAIEYNHDVEIKSKAKQ